MKKICKLLYVFLVLGLALGLIKTIQIASKKVNKCKKQGEKNKQYYNLYDHWIELKNNNIAISGYFEQKGYKTIAIYGMGDVGVQFARELELLPNITVKYVIDKNIYSDKVIFPKVDLGKDLPDVDVIVVTPIFAYKSIKRELEEYVHCPIISIEDVIYDL